MSKRKPARKRKSKEQYREQGCNEQSTAGPNNSGLDVLWKKIYQVIVHAAWQVPVLTCPFRLLQYDLALPMCVTLFFLLAIFDLVFQASPENFKEWVEDAVEAIKLSRARYLAEKEKAREEDAARCARAERLRARDEQRRRESQRQWERGRRTIRAEKNDATYVAYTDEYSWTFVLPIGFKLTAGDWEAAVKAAAENCRWEEEMDYDAFRESIKEEIQFRARPIGKGAFYKAWRQFQQEQQRQQQQYQQHYNHQQQQQRQQQQQSTRGQQQRTAAQHRQWVAAAAEPPDLDSLSDQDLRHFLEQAGSPSCTQASSSDRSELLQLARRSMQLWECRRLIKCSILSTQSTSSSELQAALCAFRIPAGPEPWEAREAARKTTQADLKPIFKALALLVHPDKAHTEHQELLHLFDDGFKYLSAAYELLQRHAVP